MQILSAQQFGGHPPSQKWRQINTDTVRVIFPPGLERQAADVAAISHQLANQTSFTIGDRLRKVNIVLQNQTTISNGYVGLGPYRSEFQIIPMQNSFDLGSLPWHYSLALHEYRHVQQYNNFLKGISKAFYYVLGEEGLSVANSAAIPDWFWEGDAVHQETITSRQGRGRLPYFFNDYRSLWASGKNYSWMKLRNGSLQDFVPNHYRLGYMLTAYGYEKFGNDFWRKVTDDAARFRGLFYPFQKAIKKYSGKNFQEFRRDGLRYFQSQTPSLDSKNVFSDIAKQQKHFRGDEEFPQWLDDQTLIMVKSSYKMIPAFVVRNMKSGVENKIRTRDISGDNYFSVRNGRLVYAAYQPDTRWRWKDYSIIKLLDIDMNEQRTITHRSKYFAPDISADGNRIVAVHVNPDGSTVLHVLQSDLGKVITAIPNKDSLFYTYPKFYGDDHIVSAVRNIKGEMSLAMITITDGTVDLLLPYSMNVIGFPSVQKDTISFTASHGEKDKLFVLINRKLFRFVAAENEDGATGNYQLSIQNGKYAFTGFTAVGYYMVAGDLSNKNFAEIAAHEFSVSLADHHLKDLKEESVIPATGGSSNYNVTPYPKLFRPFNFHSWRPYASDPEYTLSLVSENILNTLISELFFTYNRNEGYKQVGFASVYGGLFPQLRAGVHYTIDRNARLVNRTQKLYWNELETTAGVAIPFNFSKGQTFTNLSVSTDYVYNKGYITGFYKDSFEIKAFGYLNNSIIFSNQIQRARQHIYSRFAQTVFLNYKRAITNLQMEQFLASGNLYLPGVFVNHNLVLQGAFQGRDTTRSTPFSSSFPFSRGYSTENFHRMWKFGGNYHFPLFYPDWGFANIVYFLRIRANVFYDYTRIKDYDRNRQLVKIDFRSYGTEVFFDTKWWNQQPISFGFRYSRLLDADLEGRTANQFEFILPVNLLER